ncbi:MAG TPA: ClpXP protease specificity-enhancing factor [Gammaproteobacteria bacterium]|nr:ClpXP protease specificity-enhancing factor [Gammaproteobacteria bacterium]
MTSNKPYLIRAIYEWLSDNDLTPYLAVNTSHAECMVPEEYVKDGQIILNIATQAVHALLMGNDAIEFSARFGGVPRQVYVPIDAVTAIYAKENGQGIAFPEEPPSEGESSESSSGGSPPKKRGKPNLKIVK